MLRISASSAGPAAAVRKRYYKSPDIFSQPRLLYHRALRSNNETTFPPSETPIVSLEPTLENAVAMNAVRQSCRPKHQVLVLKCYPHYQKSQTSVKPNGSELSYLLYYASTRRSKLPKLGAFLDKRTVTDVWHQRIGNVQVSLQIVRALIEKCGRDLPLFAGSVLAILRTVLKSGDVTMVESTVEVWEEFCKVQDPAMLAADQASIRQYEEIVQLYVEFASKDKPFQVKGQTNVPTSMRFRKVGLVAIKSIAESQTITADAARQLNLTLPAILENLYSRDPVYLQILQQREFNREQADKEQAQRRRQSIVVVPAEEAGESDPAAALGTTEEGDVLAEQDIGVEAIQALRTFFSGNNRGLLRLCTSAVLKFVMARVKPQDHFNAQEYHTLQHGSWPTNLFGLLCFWAPVQDRYVILVTAMETLIRSPIVEDDLERQYVLALVVGWLLSSNINFIGLSVMDVLVGLMQHISLLLQLGGPDSDIRPHQQQAIISDINLASTVIDSQQPNSKLQNSTQEVVEKPTEERMQLLNQLLQCIGNLATHVYYSDQIPDMIVAVMRRLKPFSSNNPAATASAIEDPSATVETLARSISVKEKPNTDAFFSFDTARVAALQAVRSIIMVANGRAADGTSNASGRSPIGISVWEGTQWVLCDPSYQVRLAYHDALVTWLELEAKRSDLKVQEDKPRRMKSERKENTNTKGDSLARRAVSNASHRDHSPSAKRNTFLDLLHLAVYDNAHSFVESERDMLLLHSLLCMLIAKLGVNAVRSGLPMIMCLQREIPGMESPTARIHVASLVHGYFWALAVYFDFDASATARTILNEITRRTQNGTWLQTIRVPPLMPQAAQQDTPALAMTNDHVSARPGTAGTAGTDQMDIDSLKPFENSAALVDKISQGYSMSLYSPPTSPPGSPNRSFSVPILAAVGRTRSLSSQGGGPALRAPSPGRGPPELPQRIRDELVAEWSKEGCIASTASENSRSITGSFTASNRNRSAKHLSVAANGNGALSPGHHGGSPERFPLSRNPQAPGTPTSLNAAFPSHDVTVSHTPHSSSSVKSAVRVEDLKRVLAGATSGGGALRTAWSMRGPSAARWTTTRDSFGDADGDTASDSMVSADLSTNDMDVPENVAVPLPPGTEMPEVHDPNSEQEQEEALQEERSREVKEGSETPKVMSSGHIRTITEDTIRPMPDRDEGVAKPAAADAENEHVPPVPDIPFDFETERRGRPSDTDAESSVYATPGESPAPLSRVATSTSAETANTTVAREQQYADVETPKAPRESYFGEVLATVAAQALPTTDSPQTVRGTETPRQATTPTADKRSIPAQQQSQPASPTSKRKAAQRTVSYGTTTSGSGGRPVSVSARPGTAKRPGTGTRSGRNSMQRVPTGMSSGSGGSPVDTRSLLDSIEVDGYGDAVNRRPPY